jgi:hypothetical protein
MRDGAGHEVVRPSAFNGLLGGAPRRTWIVLIVRFADRFGLGERGWRSLGQGLETASHPDPVASV